MESNSDPHGFLELLEDPDFAANLERVNKRPIPEPEWPDDPGGRSLWR